MMALTIGPIGPCSPQFPIGGQSLQGSKSVRKRTKKTTELLGPAGLGGDHARRGFRFQGRWIAWNLVSWLDQDGFQTIVNEGGDDVDVKWSFPGEGRRPATTYWETFQLKDTVLDSKTIFEGKHRRFPTTFVAVSVLVVYLAPA